LGAPAAGYGRPRAESVILRVRSLTAASWNDPEGPDAVLSGTRNQPSKEDGMTTTRFTSAVRRALRALDTWTLDVFNPRYPTPRD
jgi:hypothetical protein